MGLLKKELGDILWYIAALSSELGLSMDEIAQENIDKLFDRKDRGKLRGDER
jgi:NTP pyrophosphatase (non-canonical NTP hydrolase)